MIGAGSRARRAPTRSAAVAIALAVLHGCTLEADLGSWELPGGDAAVDAASDEPAGDDLVDGGFTSQVLTVTPGLTTSYFADGRSLPAGEYTLVYQDGCWRSGIVAWTVNLGEEGYTVVGGRPEQRIAMAPGSIGTFATLGAYGSYEECVAANVGRAGITFRFEGGPLGLRLESLEPLMAIGILLEGGESVGGHSPTFRLTCAGTCR